MKALILAAGLGSRLQHVTANRPKAMTPVGDRSIIAFQIDALLKAGISDIGIVLGYKKDILQAYVTERYPTVAFRFFENDRFDDSSSGYSFWKAQSFVQSDTYIHLNCDIIFSDELLTNIIASDHPNVIGVRRDLDLGPKMENVAVDENGQIVNMAIDLFPEANAKAFGIAKLSAESTDCLTALLAPYIHSGDYHQNYYGMIRQAVSKLPYFGFLTTRRHLLEVNTLDDLEVAQQVLHSTWGSGVH